MSKPVNILTWFRRKPNVEKATDFHESPAPVYQLSDETRRKLLAISVARSSEVVRQS